MRYRESTVRPFRHEVASTTLRFSRPVPAVCAPTHQLAYPASSCGPLPRHRFFVPLNNQLHRIDAERGGQRYKSVDHDVRPSALDCADLSAMQASTVRKFFLGHALFATKEPEVRRCRDSVHGICMSAAGAAVLVTREKSTQRSLPRTRNPSPASNFDELTRAELTTRLTAK